MTAAGLVHQPAVIVAADAGLLDEAVGQVRAPVRAMAVEQTVIAAEILVEHEVLAHAADRLDRTCIELARAADRHPVAAQQSPIGVPGPTWVRMRFFSALSTRHLAEVLLLLPGILLEIGKPATTI